MKEFYNVDVTVLAPDFLGDAFGTLADTPRAMWPSFEKTKKNLGGAAGFDVTYRYFGTEMFAGPASAKWG